MDYLSKVSYYRTLSDFDVSRQVFTGLQVTIGGSNMYTAPGASARASDLLTLGGTATPDSRTDSAHEGVKEFIVIDSADYFLTAYPRIGANFFFLWPISQ